MPAGGRKHGDEYVAHGHAGHRHYVWRNGHRYAYGYNPGAAVAAGVVGGVAAGYPYSCDYSYGGCNYGDYADYGDYGDYGPYYGGFGFGPGFHGRHFGFGHGFHGNGGQFANGMELEDWFGKNARSGSRDFFDRDDDLRIDALIVVAGVQGDVAASERVDSSGAKGVVRKEIVILRFARDDKCAW